VNAGPGLIFEALPKVFAEMSGGRVWGTVFFFFLTLAAVTTVVAVFECLIGGLMEAFGWRRGWTAAAVGALVAAGSLPAVMCGGALEAEDFVFSQLWLPTGAMLISVFVSTRAGWGFEKFSAEASAGEGIRLPRAFGPLLRYFVPLMILILVIGAAVTS
ncbi:MAG: sodium-dependent transporter, partial [Kiritimatiellae bacterium]|nr:sodium-dependent transporter [Kiritimatiellia bacterium]